MSDSQKIKLGDAISNINLTGNNVKHNPVS